MRQRQLGPRPQPLASQPIRVNPDQFGARTARPAAPRLVEAGVQLTEGRVPDRGGNVDHSRPIAGRETESKRDEVPDIDRLNGTICLLYTSDAADE